SALVSAIRANANINTHTIDARNATKAPFKSPLLANCLLPILYIMLKPTSPTPVRIKIIFLNPADSSNFLDQPQNLTNIKIPSNTIKKVNSGLPQIPGAADPAEPNNANTFFPPSPFFY